MDPPMELAPSKPSTREGAGRPATRGLESSSGQQARQRSWSSRPTAREKLRDRSSSVIVIGVPPSTEEVEGLFEPSDASVALFEEEQIPAPTEVHTMSPDASLECWPTDDEFAHLGGVSCSASDDDEPNQGPQGLQDVFAECTSEWPPPLKDESAPFQSMPPPPPAQPPPSPSSPPPAPPGSSSPSPTDASSVNNLQMSRVHREAVA